MIAHEAISGSAYTPIPRIYNLTNNRMDGGLDCGCLIYAGQQITFSNTNGAAWIIIIGH